MIEELYAIIDDTEGNGIVGVNLGGEWMPLVFTDPTSTKIELGRHVARELGKVLTLVKFSNREDMEKFLP